MTDSGVGRLQGQGSTCSRGQRTLSMSPAGSSAMKAIGIYPPARTHPHPIEILGSRELKTASSQRDAARRRRWIGW